LPAIRELWACFLECAAPLGRHTFLIVDQFEELFTLCHQPFERAAFVDNLLDASLGDAASVLIALRANVYAHCASITIFARRLRLTRSISVHWGWTNCAVPSRSRQSATAGSSSLGWSISSCATSTASPAHYRCYRTHCWRPGTAGRHGG
jgi:hypothetical protein